MYIVLQPLLQLKHRDHYKHKENGGASITWTQSVRYLFTHFVDAGSIASSLVFQKAVYVQSVVGNSQSRWNVGNYNQLHRRQVKLWYSD